MFGKLLKGLDASARHDWALKLASGIFEGETDSSQAQLLGELCESRENEDWTDIFDLLAEGSRKAVSVSLESSQLLDLSHRVPELRDHLIGHAQAQFEQYLVPSNVVHSFRQFLDNDTQSSAESVESESDDVDAVDVTCLAYLKLLFDFALKSSSLALSDEMQTQLLNLQGSKDEAISQWANKVFGVAIDKTSFANDHTVAIWNRVTALLSAGDYSSAYKTFSLKLWLWWIDRTVNIKENEQFQDILQSEEYWKLILDGVTTGSYDEKKYCLYILTNSLYLFTQDVNNKYMVWDMSRVEDYMNDWRRYSTLVEIICIDTSLNQTVASHGDILTLLSANSSIPSAWAISLLTSAISSPMDSIRKFVGDTILALAESHLGKFRYGIDFVVNVFLPYVMNGFYYQVIETNGKYECEHVDALADFVRRYLSVLDNVGANEFLNQEFLYLQKNQNIFDPSRIYVVKGIEDALRKRQILTMENINTMAQLSGSSLETPLKSKMLFLLFIEILFSAPVEAAEKPDEWFKALNAFLTNHEELVVPNLTRHIAKFIEKSNLTTAFNNTNSLDAAFKAEIYMKINKDRTWLDNLSFDDKCHVIMKHLPDSQRYLCESATSGFIDELKGKVHHTWFYHCQVAEQIVKYQPMDWGWYTCSFMMEDFRNLAAWLRTSRLMPCTTASQKGLWAVVLPKLSRPVTGEFRSARQRALTEFYRTLAHYTEVSEVFDIAIDEISSVIEEHFVTADSKCQTSICYFLEEALKRTASFDGEKLASLFSSMWSAITEDRLMLSDRPLHLAFIDAVFGKPCVGKNDSEVFKSTLEDLAIGVIDQTFARRSICPHLARKLYVASSKDQLWVARVFCYMYLFQQNEKAVFTIETIIAKSLDERLAQEGYHTNTYVDIYGDYETVSRVFAMAYVSQLTCDHTELFDYLVENYDSLWSTTNADESSKKRVLYFHLLLVLEHHLDDKKAFEYMSDRFMPLIDIEPLPLIRTYAEWFIGRTLCRDPERVSPIIIDPLSDAEQQPRILGSLGRLGLLIGRQLKNTVNVAEASDYYREFIARMLPLAASNRAVVRHNAVSLVYAIYCEYDSLSDEFKAYLSDLLYAIKTIAESAAQADSFKNYRSGNNALWGLEGDYTLTGICGGVLKRLSDKSMPAITEPEWTAFFEENGGTPNIPIGQDDSEFWKKPSKTVVDSGKEKASSSNYLQTKSGVWANTIDPAEESQKMNIERGDLVVLASLVDKPPNLGGICRLSDVLGAGLLCMHDMNVAKHPQFKGVAVTADRWMPMHEVPISEIIPYMRSKKSEGYTLIGLEQTDNSVQLDNNLKFPRKSVLLLGKEREGIPGDLLAELDFCVEIKQVGVVRSMNIQTATAVVVHAYSTQHC